MSISPVSSSNIFAQQQQPLNGTSQAQSKSPTEAKHRGHHHGGAGALQSAEASSVASSNSSNASSAGTSLVGSLINITA
jgi:hypothetical protein